MTAKTPMPLRLHLVRHGETEWSLSGQHTGCTDIPLTPHGEEESRALRHWLDGSSFAQVLTRPRQRSPPPCALVGLGTSA